MRYEITLRFLEKMKLKIKSRNVEKFVEDFSKEINNNFTDVCFFLYGSVLRNDFVVESSDIDGGLIFDCDVVLPKVKIRDITKSLFELKTKYNVRPEFNLTDRITNKDGRFVSYTNDYTEHFKTGAKVFSKKKFLDEICGLNYRHSALHAVAFNLREQRNKLMIVGETQEDEFHKVKEAFLTSLEKIRGTPKKLVFLQTGDWIFDKEKVLKSLKKILPNYEQEFLRYTLQLRKNPSLLEKVREKEIIKLYEDSVTETEKIIREYIKNYPQTSWREARCDMIIKKLFEYDSERGVYLLNAS